MQKAVNENFYLRFFHRYLLFLRYEKGPFSVVFGKNRCFQALRGLFLHENSDLASLACHLLKRIKNAPCSTFFLSEREPLEAENRPEIVGNGLKTSLLCPVLIRCCTKLLYVSTEKNIII